MTPTKFMTIFGQLTSIGYHDLAGAFLLRAMNDVDTPITRLPSASLELARQYNMKEPLSIARHLEDGDSRPNLSVNSCVGRLYSLSALQRAWITAYTGLPPTRLVMLAWINARTDDPSVVDQCCLESLITASEASSRSRILTRFTFTWADLMSLPVEKIPSSLKINYLETRRTLIGAKPREAKLPKPTAESKPLTEAQLLSLLDEYSA